MQRLMKIALLLVVATVTAYSQVGTQASLGGTIQDTTGALVPGAQIVLTNLATGEERSVTSDTRGNYEVLALQPGHYKVTVSASGFKTWTMSDLQLTVGDRSHVDSKLEVGSTSTTVEVEGTTGLLQTDNATVETVVQMQQIREMPLDTRNPLALTALVPGMSYQGTTVGSFRDTFVQGQGLRNYTTNFQLDGLSSNAASSEGGSAIPNVDAVEEFNVQTLNPGPEAGRDPAQVLVVTKSGTNEFHGTGFEFNQNDMFSARNAFATKKNRIRYNQFGGTLGGPVIRKRTFFFGSYQQTIIGNANVFNESAVTTAMEGGDFSALSKPIINPYTGQQFPNNKIPSSMIDASAQYFLKYFVTANTPTGFFQAQGNSPNTTYEYLGRVDHQITLKQHIYGRFEYVHEPITVLGYTPTYVSSSTTNEPNLGINYTWTPSDKTLLTATGGLMRDNFTYNNPLVGKQNDSQMAGIQGISSAGREAWIGPPDIGISGYTGISFSGGGYGGPGFQGGGEYDGKLSFSHIMGAHTAEVGGEYFNRTTYGDHGSAAPRGVFNFYNLYTGNGFADFLLGLTSSSSLNDPLGKFGQTLDPILSFYGKDTWKVTSNLTVSGGLRYDRFLEHKCWDYICAIWNPVTNKTVVSTDSHGNPNFTHFPTTAAFAQSTVGLWQTAQDAGYPHGLYEANGNWEPRIGATYRLFGSRVVLRGAYGIYYNLFTGNRDASEINMPLWTVYSQSFGLNTLQQWESVWAGGPSGTSPFSIYSPLVNTSPTKTQEWNVAAEIGLPANAAFTVTYVGTNASQLGTWKEYNAPPVGFNQNIQADRPNPRFSNITLTANEGRNWFNGLQTKLERRFEHGLAFTAAYSWSKTMTADTGSCETCTLLQYSPTWYNRHVATFQFPHVESATVVWQAPYGHGRRFGAKSNGAVDAVLGGWELSGLQTAHSGGPMEITQSNGNLGNGYSSRTNLIGNPSVQGRSAAEWFNTGAFALAPLYTFGNSGVGAVKGPGAFQLNSGVDKDFPIGEGKYFQFRWETYNLFNNVNYSNPDTNFNDAAFGRITSSGSARYMQFGGKIVF